VLSRHCKDFWGIDYLPENIAYAKETRPHLNLVCGDMRSIRLSRTFDVILCLGSALMHSLTNRDVELTLETFAAHPHNGTLLIIDVNNASGFLAGGLCETQKTIQVDNPEFLARATISYGFDRRCQHLVRKRVWEILGAETVEDYCRYRMFFPAEFDHILASRGFCIHGMWDNNDLDDSDVRGVTLYVAASFDSARSKFGAPIHS
jgi:hypothetical protein